MDLIFSSDTVLELELWTRSLSAVLGYRRFPFSWCTDDSGNSKLEIELVRDILHRLDELCRREKAHGHAGWALWLDEEQGGTSSNLSPLGLLEDSINKAQYFVAAVAAQSNASLKALCLSDTVLQPALKQFCRSAYFRELTYRHFGSRVEPVICTAVLSRVSAPALRAELSEFFLQIARLAAYLRFVHKGLSNFRQPRLFFLAFVLVHLETHTLCRRLRNLGRIAGHLDPGCGDALQTVHNAVKIESRRVFRRELRNINRVENNEELRVRLENSAGVLLNCVQNCFVSLARSFNPQFSGHPVLDDGVERLEESVLLLNDLKRLSAQLASASRDEGEFFGFLSDLQMFEQGSMRFLRYKDQLELLDFIELLAHCRDRRAREKSLHQLAVFLDALFSEVSKRDALKGVASVKSPPAKLRDLSGARP